MRAFVKVLVGSVCLLACTAHPSPPSEVGASTEQPIIGGTADNGDVSVVMLEADDGDTGWWCTGTVIAKRLVLTAAHCVDDATASTKMKIMFAPDQSLAKPSDFIAVTSWAHDPMYLATNNIAAGHDAAVLILAADAPVPSLPINHTALVSSMVGSPVHVVGYGDDNGQAGTGAGVKREIHTTLASLEQGVANVGHTGETTCQGDSGGPSFMNIGGVDVIVGITSYGEEGCTDYGSVTRVDLSASWIDPYIAANGGGGVCTPSCAGKSCGSDGCGGTCGAGVCGTCDTNGGIETEPNDARGTANALCSNGTITAKIGTATDVDWFTFTVPPSSAYTVDLASSNGYEMTLLKLLTSGSLSTVETQSIEIAKRTTTGGTYYLKVLGTNGRFSATEPYSVAVNITAD